MLSCSVLSGYESCIFYIHKVTFPSSNDQRYQRKATDTELINIYSRESLSARLFSERNSPRQFSSSFLFLTAGETALGPQPPHQSLLWVHSPSTNTKSSGRCFHTEVISAEALEQYKTRPVEPAPSSSIKLFPGVCANCASWKNI